MLINAVLIGLSLMTIWMLYMIKNFSYWKDRKVPFVKPKPIFGNMITICLGMKSIGQFLREVYQKTSEPYIGLFSFNEPCLLVNDLDLIKSILVRDFHHFTNRTIADNEKCDKIGSTMLFLLKTPRWHSVRRRMTPVFSTGKLKLFSDIMLDSGRKLVEYIEKTTGQNNVIETREMCAKFTVNSIAATTLGLEADGLDDKNSPFIVIANKIFNWKRLWYSFQVTCYVIAPKLVELFNMKFIDTESSASFRDIFWKSLAERKISKIVRNDLIDILLGMSENDEIFNAESQDRDILVAQFAQFFLAGFETTSSTMSFALAELALNPDIQAKLRKEIIAVKKIHGSFSYVCINEMEYLENTILETLRKYPVLPYLDRRCNKAYSIPGSDITLCEGQRIYISIMGIHQNEKYYPNPEKFDPDRFSKANRDRRHNLTFLAFGAGPRNCIGQRLGMLNAKIGLAHILLNFEAKICHKTENKLTLIPRGMLLQPQNGINLEFIKHSLK